MLRLPIWIQVLRKRFRVDWSKLRLLRYSTFQIGLGMLLIALFIFDGYAFRPWWQLGTWAIGLTLLQIGTFTFSTVPQPAADQILPWATWEVAVVGILTTIALIVRASMIDHIPFAIHGDEGEMGLVARTVLKGTLRQPFGIEWIGHPNLWFFLQAAALRLFGDSIGGLRLLSALIGTAAIPICYWFARPHLGRTVAIGGAILLMALPMHIHFSRIALNNIIDPTLGTAGLGLLLSGWRNGKPATFLGSGLLLGLAQHGYFGARLLIVLWGVLILHRAVWNGKQFVAQWKGLLLLVLGFGAGLGPLLRYYIENPATYTDRINDLGLFQSGRIGERMQQGESLSGILVDQLWRGFGAFTVLPDVGFFFASPQPILDGASAVLFVCGLVIALRHFREPIYALLVVWIGCTALFGGVLIGDSPQTSRYMIAAPAICLLAALGLVRIIEWVWRRFGAVRGRSIAMACCVAYLAIQGIGVYFLQYTPQMYYAGTPTITLLAKYIQARRAEQYIYFLGKPYVSYRHGTIRFMAPGVSGEDVGEPITSLAQVPTPSEGLHAVYIALPARLAELYIIQECYPGGLLSTVPDLRDPTQLAFAVYEAP